MILVVRSQEIPQNNTTQQPLHCTTILTQEVYWERKSQEGEITKQKKGSLGWGIFPEWRFPGWEMVDFQVLSLEFYFVGQSFVICIWRGCLVIMALRVFCRQGLAIGVWGQDWPLCVLWWPYTTSRRMKLDPHLSFFHKISLKWINWSFIKNQITKTSKWKHWEYSLRQWRGLELSEQNTSNTGIKFNYQQMGVLEIISRAHKEPYNRWKSLSFILKELIYRIYKD